MNADTAAKQDDDLTRDLATKLAAPGALGGSVVTRTPAFKSLAKVTTLDHLDGSLQKLFAAYQEMRGIADSLIGKDADKGQISLTFEKGEGALIEQVHRAAQDVENLGLAISQEVARIKAGI
jgi:hypothetical protein